MIYHHQSRCLQYALSPSSVGRLGHSDARYKSLGQRFETGQSWYEHNHSDVVVQWWKKKSDIWKKNLTKWWDLLLCEMT